MTLYTPEYPEGRRIIVIANDITCSIGSFGPDEDILYQRASQLARREVGCDVVALPFLLAALPFQIFFYEARKKFAETVLMPLPALDRFINEFGNTVLKCQTLEIEMLWTTPQVCGTCMHIQYLQYLFVFSYSWQFACEV